MPAVLKVILHSVNKIYLTAYLDMQKFINHFSTRHFCPRNIKFYFQQKVKSKKKNNILLNSLYLYINIDWI